jgi:HAD superfamily hydrolase (TIGR01509 family)
MLHALIFDVDGTLADTEAAHCAAFNQAFSQFGLDWHWDDALYTGLLSVTGGRERIVHYMKTAQPDLNEFSAMDPQGLVDHLFQLKTIAYVQQVNDGALNLRPGVLKLIGEALDQGLKLAIATTTSPVNIAALLCHAMGADWRTHFSAIGDGTSVSIKKPHPQVYLDVLAALALPASQCLALEDSSNGLRAASAAGLATLITPTRYTAKDDFSAAMRVTSDLEQVDLALLRTWHAQSQQAKSSLNPTDNPSCP